MNKKRAQRRVVVTGLGLVTPLGLDVEENWKTALLGVSGIDKVKLPDSEKSPVHAVGEVKESDWKKIKEEFPEDALQEGERRTLFALWAAKSALCDAGIVKREGARERERYGVSFAAGLGINRL